MLIPSLPPVADLDFKSRRVGRASVARRSRVGRAPVARRSRAGRGSEPSGAFFGFFLRILGDPKISPFLGFLLVGSWLLLGPSKIGLGRPLLKFNGILTSKMGPFWAPKWTPKRPQSNLQLHNGKIAKTIAPVMPNGFGYLPKNRVLVVKFQ